MYVTDGAGEEFYLNDFVLCAPNLNNEDETDVHLHDGRTLVVAMPYGKFTDNWHRMKG